jgi:hypothetical protein
MIYWTPRALCIAYALFLALFSLDVFNEGLGFGRTLQALAIHLIPAAIVVAILVLAWRWEWIGTVLLGGAALYYSLRTMQNVNLSEAVKVNWILVVAGPGFVIAALFLVNWLKRGELHARI